MVGGCKEGVRVARFGVVGVRVVSWCGVVVVVLWCVAYGCGL